MNADEIIKCLPELEKELIAEIKESILIKQFAKGAYIIKQGQFVRHLPIVLSGSVKVFSNEDAIQFLLYYIESGAPCIFSFAHLLNEEPIEFSAVAEQNCELLMLPIRNVRLWLKVYTSFSHLLLQSYEKHYKDLLNTTKEIICFGLEQRLLNYLKTRSALEQSIELRITHQEIAEDLGTSREVITRIMKKISKEKKVIQLGRKIKLL